MKDFITWLFKEETIIWLVAFNFICSLLLANWLAALAWVALFGAEMQIIGLKGK